MRIASTRLALVALILCGTGACSDRARSPDTGPRPSRSAAPSAPSTPTDDLDARALITRFECARCHGALGEVPASKSCTVCHDAIRAGTFAAAAADLARWQGHVRTFLDIPSLSGAAMLRRDYVVRQLLAPSDQRPGLAAMMPRLAISDEEARAIAAFLVPSDDASSLPRGDAARGRASLASLGCTQCHATSNAPVVEATPDVARAVALAPDLRLTRHRLRPAAIARFLAAPRALVPDGAMPDFGLTEPVIRDLVTCLLECEFEPPATAPIASLPSPLSRPVRYEEVDARVFHASCRHCHATAEFALGDGGAGNTGGFGFPPRGIVLDSFTGSQSGSIGADGRRHSLYEPMPDGTPRLVAVLLARHVEVSGGSVEGLRGMPLGMPPLPLEDIALIDAWIRQGRSR